MADNKTFQASTLATLPSGTVVATDEIAGADYQKMKLVDGTADSTTAVAAGGGVEANALRVTVASDSSGVLSVDDNGGSLTVDGTVTVQDGGGAISVDDNGSTLSIDDGGGSITVDGTVAVSGSVDTELTTADLDTGAGTDTRAVIGLVGAKSGGAALIPGDATKGLAVDLTATGQNSTALKVDGSAVTQPVSASSLPLPTGAATAAKQPAIGTAGSASTDVITVQGIASGTALAVNSTPVSPGSILNGVTNVTTAGTRVVLASSTTCRSVTVRAKHTNTGVIYVGNSSVSSSNGYTLLPGESISLDITNLNTVNLDAATSGEGVTYLGVA